MGHLLPTLFSGQHSADLSWSGRVGTEAWNFTKSNTAIGWGRPKVHCPRLDTPRMAIKIGPKWSWAIPFTGETDNVVVHFLISNGSSYEKGHNVD